MNLNKIETDQPGFILPNPRKNNKTRKTTDEPKERKINSTKI